MQGGSSGIGYGLKYQVTESIILFPIFSVNFLKAYSKDESVSGEMYIGCESRYGLHQLPHWNPKFERRKRGGFSMLRFLFDHLQHLRAPFFLSKKVHLLRLSSGGSELICEGLFSHPNEIWDLASCPFDQRIFSTVFSTGIISFLKKIVIFFRISLGLITSWSLKWFDPVKVNHLEQRFGRFLSCMVS